MTFYHQSSPWLPRAFAQRVHQELSLDLRAIILPEASYSPLDDRPSSESMFFGSDHARERPCLMQDDADWFMTQAPDGYAQIGFWGHGVNSFAFYYARVDHWSRVFLRLPYGGVYMNNHEAATRIRLYLPALFEFEQRIKAHTTSWSALEVMGMGRYQRHTSERSWELRESVAMMPDPLLALEDSLF